MNYITGKYIRELREKQKYTQKQLADRLGVSEKTISKWETEKGLPDITLLDPLAKELHVSLVELFNGEYHENRNRSADLRKSKLYYCPLCGNVINSLGEGTFTCCGILLPPIIPEEPDEEHSLELEKVDNEYYVHVDHPMEKDHYISYIIYVTSDRIQIVRFYPEQNAETRFKICGHGYIYVCCNKHGVYKNVI